MAVDEHGIEWSSREDRDRLIIESAFGGCAPRPKMRARMRVNFNQLITNPATGKTSFGTFPLIDFRRAQFAGGPIVLRRGRHTETGHGFGFMHIWQARYPQCTTESTAISLVTDLISRIIAPGASIHYEFVNLGSADRRTSVFRNGNGIVVVEERLDDRASAFYSIVTAYPAQRVNGHKIGAL